MPLPPSGTLWQFDRFTVLPEQRLLLHEGTPVPLTSKSLDTLLVLIENRDRVVTKDELLRSVWPDVEVEEGNLTQQVFLLRKALGETAQQPRYIATVPGHGYRFMAPLQTTSADQGYPSREVQSGASRWTVRYRKSTRSAVGLIALGIVGLLAIVSGWRWLTRDKTGTRLDWTNARPTKVTESGSVTSAAISLDGRYLAYVENDGDEYSLWVQPRDTAGKTEIVRRQSLMLTSLSFSPDGKDIYFTRGTPKRGKFQLCRIPSGGGLVTPILDDVDSAISFSPDRRKFVFMRGADLETQIVVSAADGSWQYPLTKQTFPHWFSFAAPDWSPDGKSVAAGLVDESKGLRSSIVLIPVDTPENGREIYSSTGYFGRLRWLPDMSGLLTIVLEDVSPEGAESQFSRMSGGSLWRIRYPDGRAEPLMPDLADYDLYTLDISTDGSVATVMNSLVSDLWIASADHLDAAERITKDHPVVARHAWLPDNDTMIYRDMRGNLNAVTKDRREFRLALPAGQRVVGGVSACGVSGEVVFQAAPGNNIWRVTPTAGNPARLTGGLIDKNPACSPDGQSVWYASLGTEPSSLKQIPIEGGRPTATIPGEAFEALVSPKGKMIYYWAWAWEDQPVRTRLGRWNVIGARDQTLHFNVPANATDGIPPAWAPDESGLDYIVTQNGVSNIWRLPLGGGPPVPVTRLSANQIFSFAWSPDGRWLSFASGFNRSDVVVLSRRP